MYLGENLSKNPNTGPPVRSHCIHQNVFLFLYIEIRYTKTSNVPVIVKEMTKFLNKKKKIKKNQNIIKPRDVTGKDTPKSFKS